MRSGTGVRFRSFARRVKLAAQYERRVRARRTPIDDLTVLYESFAGNGMLCNPAAIFRSLLAADDMQDLRHVWALSDLDQYASTVDEFAHHPRVTFVKRGSLRYYAALSSAKYLVNNATFPDGFGKRAGQIYLNTWHGTPLKAMGYDVPDGAVDTRNIVRNFVNADYLLAPNDDTARMYLTGYRMANIFRGHLVAEGTPRVDCQFADEHQQEQIRTRLAAHGLMVDATQKILLYAPTWKGDFYAPTDDIAQLRWFVESVSAQLDSDRDRLLLKVHQKVYERARNDPALRGVLVPNNIPTNDVLSVTDAVITDYSSIFIDFLVTGRPVLFYTPDLDDYAASRGLYLPPEQWPGPVCREIEQLVRHINDLGSGSDTDPSAAYAEAYETARMRFCAREDGNAAARIVDIVFRGATRDYDLRSGFADGRTSILVHVGGLRANGITSSALSLLGNIDHERFDVSVSFPHTADREQQQLVELIHPQVRLFPQSADRDAGKIRVRTLAAVNGRSPQHRQVLASHYTDLMHDEWTRSFGASRFDYVVDFSGYAPYWIKLLASRPSGSFSIWLHNDMRAELSNPSRSAQVRASVRGAIALYREADHLVSVSEPLRDINRMGLAGWASADRFTHARNTINTERIRRLAYDLDEAERQAVLRRAVSPAPGVRTFVTAGRLSSEKNHLRLIRAFGLVHDADANTRLVILGTGPQLDRLHALVEELGLGAAVTLAGHHPNPYVIMADSDCFVLSSDYEGQPMALLEALILGIPVVTTAFDSVRGALPHGSGLVVAPTVEALADGMRAFLRGEVSSQPFDHASYTRLAMAEFYRAIGSA